MYDILELNNKLLPELREIAKELNIKKVDAFKKQDLVYKILDQQAIIGSGKTKPDRSKDQEKIAGVTKLKKKQCIIPGGGVPCLAHEKEKQCQKEYSDNNI